MGNRKRGQYDGSYVFNATIVDSLEITGVERYAIELIRHSKQRYKDLIVLCHPSGAEIFRNMDENLQIFISPFHNRVLTDQLWLPWIIRRLKPMAVFNISLAHPWVGFGNIPFSMMVHDAVPWRYPDELSTGARFYYKPLIQRAIKDSQLRSLFTNSESSRLDIIHYCGVKPELVSAVHLGVNHDLFHQIDSDFMGHRYTDLDFILAVGTLEPRKNLHTVIRAFQEISWEWPEICLIIVGRHGWLKELEIPSEIEERIVFTGYVSDESLVGLYSMAKLFVFPSKYEGFGFPMLEAMCCGTPVLVSRTSSLPEIGQTACLYADPNRPDDFALKMRSVLENEQLRSSLSFKARKQAQKFNWNKTAKETWMLLDDAFVTKSDIVTRAKRIAGYNFLSLSFDEMVELIVERADNRLEQLNLFTVNVDILLQAERDESLAKTLRQDGVLVADGMPIVWLSKLVRAALPGRVAGSDLVESLCMLGSTSGLRFFLLGAAAGIAETAAKVLCERYGTEVCGYLSPSRDEILDEILSAQIVERVNASGANVLLVGFGAPLQEQWIAHHAEALTTHVNIAVGGTIDFLAGRIPRAPVWMRRGGLEWFYRLVHEPKRLWRRYLIRDFAFLRVIISALWSTHNRRTPEKSEHGMSQ